MSRLQSFLEQLVGAGILPSADQILGDAEQVKTLEGMLGTDPAEVQSLQQERDQLKSRLSGQDAKISQYDNRVKELEKQVGQKTADVGDTSAQFRQMLTQQKQEMDQAYATKMDQILNMLQAQTQKTQELEAKEARRNALTQLAEEYPVLKDSQFHALMPETADENLLRERAGLLTKLRDATETHAFEEIRAGHIPATMPPKVIPGKPETLERELNTIAGRRDRGEITPQQAGVMMDEVMQAFNKR